MLVRVMSSLADKMSPSFRKNVAELYESKVAPGGLTGEEYASLITLDPAQKVAVPAPLATRGFTASAVRDSRVFLDAVAPSVAAYFDHAQSSQTLSNDLTVMVTNDEVMVTAQGIIENADDVDKLIAVGIAAVTAAVG